MDAGASLRADTLFTAMDLQREDYNITKLEYHFVFSPKYRCGSTSGPASSGLPHTTPRRSGRRQGRNRALQLRPDQGGGTHAHEDQAADADVTRPKRRGLPPRRSGSAKVAREGRECDRVAGRGGEDLHERQQRAGVE